MPLGYGGPYETKANILSFLQKIKSDLVLSDITDMIYNSATEIINNKTDTYWDIFAGDLYVNGGGVSHIMSPVVPIVTLTGLTIIELDETETELIVSGSDRQLIFNEETGLIRRIDDLTSSNLERDLSPNDSVFPDGERNIKISGTFGRDADSLNVLALLQTLLVMRTMRFQFPSEFNATDLLEEKVGEYSYRIGDMQYSTNQDNQKKTLDGYIDYLFKLLPKDDQMGILAV